MAPDPQCHADLQLHEAARRTAPPAVSVICTAKNAAVTINHTLESIVAQEFSDWEMIIVDDGSTDGTVSVVNAFAQADPRIRLVATAGIGRGRALNRALAEAQADLVANIDADDVGHPSMLRCLLCALNQHPQFTIMSTEHIAINGTTRPGWPEIDLARPWMVEDVTRKVAIYNPIYHSAVMMRKARILELGGYDEERHAVFDWDLWVRCAAAGLRLGRIRLPLGAQRIHPDQSYQYSSRLRYLMTGAAVQRRAMRALGITPLYLPLIGLRFLWGVLPLRVRLGVRELRSLWGASQPPSSDCGDGRRGRSPLSSWSTRPARSDASPANSARRCVASGRKQ